MNTAIEYFSIFGGIEIDIDISKPLKELIEKHILNDYDNLKYKIHKLTGGYSVEHAILSGIALGDRKTTTSFKRAHVSFEEGMMCVENLCNKGIIEIESPQNYLLNKRGKDNKVAKKLLFTTPFLRFWFAFVSPIYKGIKDKNYKEFYEKFENKIAEFSDFIFEELCIELTTDFFEDDPIDKIGKYWDENREISIVARTKSGKIIAGNCRYVNSKIKRNELNKLINDCKDINLNVDIYILFTKNGFTSELKSMKNENLKLFTPRNLKILLN